MGFLKRLAFYLGFALGLAAIAAMGIVGLTYLFTGKFPSVDVEEGQPELQLMTPDEVVALVREQVDKAKATEIAGGESDDES
jgi:hypothetical protein